MSDSPARRWILTAAVAAVLVVVAIVAARAIRDHDRSSDASASARTTTTSGASTTAPTPTTVPSTTTVAPTTTTTPTTGSAPATTGPPGPCGSDTAAIRAALEAGSSAAAPGSDLASCRLAASDPSWAAARVGTTIVVLHRDAGAWTVVAQGGTDAGCGRAPQQVIVDLGQFCVATGGGAS